MQSNRIHSISKRTIKPHANMCDLLCDCALWLDAMLVVVVLVPPAVAVPDAGAWAEKRTQRWAPEASWAGLSVWGESGEPDVPLCWGLAWALPHLPDLQPLPLVTLRLPPDALAVGGATTEGGALPRRVNRASISSFWRRCKAWISTICLQKDKIFTLRTCKINVISPVLTVETQCLQLLWNCECIKWQILLPPLPLTPPQITTTSFIWSTLLTSNFCFRLCVLVVLGNKWDYFPFPYFLWYMSNGWWPWLGS